MHKHMTVEKPHAGCISQKANDDMSPSRNGKCIPEDRRDRWGGISLGIVVLSPTVCRFVGVQGIEMMTVLLNVNTAPG